MRTIFLALLVIACVAGPVSRPTGGIYSNSAASIWGVSTTTIPSPDGKNCIIVGAPKNPNSDETHTVSIQANGKRYTTKIGSWVNAEAVWSADSKAFVVTYSDGGNVGTYHVKVVYVSSRGLRIVEPVSDGARLFAPTCYHPEYPNVGAVKWTRQDSSCLLIAVEVPPHSSCASMGNFRAFEVAVPSGAVIHRYGQLAAKKLFWKDLGIELREADDDCVHAPRRCVPPGLELNKKRTKN